MKKDIHPEFHDAAKVFCNGEEVLTVSGTRAEYVVDVWSGNHPFYTGQQTTNVSEESRIAQFQKKYGGMYGTVAPMSQGGNTKLEYKKGGGGKKKK
jgi:ribosomal protein L31